MLTILHTCPLVNTSQTQYIGGLNTLNTHESSPSEGHGFITCVSPVAEREGCVYLKD